MKKYIGVTKPINIVAGNEANLDAKYGPYNSINEAITILPKKLRAIGMTIGVIKESNIVEYWWKKGIEDNNLVVKIDKAAATKVSELENDRGFKTKSEIDDLIKIETNRAKEVENNLESNKLDKDIFDNFYLNGSIKQPAVNDYNTSNNSLASVYGLTSSGNGSNGKVKQNGWDVLVRNDETKGGISNRYNWNGSIWVDMETGNYPKDVALKEDLEKVERESAKAFNLSGIFKN